MEDLDVFAIEVPEDRVWDDQIGEDVTVFDDVDLVQGKVVVDDEELADLRGQGLF